VHETFSLRMLHDDLQRELVAQSRRALRLMLTCVVLAAANLALASFSVVRLHDPDAGALVWAAIGINAWGCYAIAQSGRQVWALWRKQRQHTLAMLATIERRLEESA
jgi:hypothetical protein